MLPVLQPVVEACDLNFVQIDLSGLPAQDVVDQQELERELATINEAYCDHRGLDARERVPIANILASSTRASGP